MEGSDPGSSNAGKLVVIGLIVISVAMFVLLLPNATERVLDRLHNVLPLVVVVIVAAIAFVVAWMVRRH